MTLAVLSRPLCSIKCSFESASICLQTAVGAPPGFGDQLHLFVRHYAALTAVPDDAEVLALFGLCSQLCALRWQTAIGVPAGFEDQLHRFVQHYAAPTAVPDDAEVLALFGLCSQLCACLYSRNQISIT
jgi:hypothetical protein